MNSPKSPKSVVLLGIGHTNAHVVQQWAIDPPANCQLTCISNYPTSTYSGMLPGTLGEQFEDAEMRINLKALADRGGAKSLIAETIGLDLDAGLIRLQDHEPVRFDVLSIGVGSMPVGWQKHCDSPLLVPIKPMQTFLSRLQKQLEAPRPDSSDPLRIAIVGGGVASVEIAFCLRELLIKRREERPYQIEIFCGDEHVAGGMSHRSVARIESLLLKYKITIRRSSRVTHVNNNSIDTDDGRTFESDCIIWATGASAPEVLGRLGLPTDGKGFLAIRKTLQSTGDDRIFAVGDCGTMIQSPWPKAGVYAVRQSPILWHNVRAALKNEPLKTFEPQNDFLKILNTGDGKAVLEYGRFTAHARWCWWLKKWIDEKFIQKFRSK